MFPGLFPNSGTGKRAPKMFHGNALVNCFRYELPEGVSRKCFRGVVFGRFFGTAPFFSLFLMNAGCFLVGEKKWQKSPRPTVGHPPVGHPRWVTHGGWWGFLPFFSPRPRNNQRSLKTKKKTALSRNTFQKPRPENISWRRLLEARTGSS